VDWSGDAVTDGAGFDQNKQPRRIAGMFDAIASRYDLLNHLLSAGLDIHWRNRAIASLGLRGGETVLDLCTGTADLALAAAGASPAPSRVVGLDFAGRMLARGAAKIARSRRGSAISLAQADVTAIPMRSGSVQATTVAFGIRNVEAPERAFGEVFRVLAPGGRFAMLEFGVPRVPVVRSLYLWYFRHALPLIGRLVSGHESAYAYLPASVSTFPEPDRVRLMLRAAGFDDVRAVPLTLGVVYLYVARKRDVRQPARDAVPAADGR
jgi:demethylmenaquinone methyltransferase/2-methoxy-6-polyprenyl-1,4-benzoquinol methylase